MKQIALFGGGFNPPHLAHLFTVTYLLSRHDVDEVWLLPAYKHAFNKTLQPFKERVLMLQKLFPNHGRVKVCEVEAEQNLSGKTFETLDYLSKQNPNYQFSLSIGSDNLALADRWYRFHDLIARWRLIVMLRPGFDLSQSKVILDHKHVVWPAILPAVSSSQIRSTLANNAEEIDWAQEPLSMLPSILKEDALRLYSSSGSSNDLPLVDASSNFSFFDSDRHGIFIWGQGRCGKSLNIYFQTLGLRSFGVSLKSFTKEANWQFEANELEIIIEQALGYDVWLIACKDDQIQSLSTLICKTLISQFSELCYHGLKPKIIMHCSGSRPRSVLSHFEEFNWKIAQFHPLLSFKSKTTSAQEMKGLYIAISADQQLKPKLIELLTLLKFSPLDLDSISSSVVNKTLDPKLVLSLYHCAAVFGANLSLLPFMLCEDLLEKLNFPGQIANQAFQVLYRSALSPFPFSGKINFETDQNDRSLLSVREKFKKALTGPIARDDVNTLKLHLESLRQLESLLNENQSTFGLSSPSSLLSESYLYLSLLTARSYQALNCVLFLKSELKSLNDNLLK